MENFKKQVGENIKYYRKNIQMTLKELSKRVGIAEGTMQKYEAGNITRVDIEMISKIADALNVKPEQLTGWTKEKSPVIHSSSPEEINKALDFYEKYQNAIPEIQQAVEGLLKPNQHKP